MSPISEIDAITSLENTLSQLEDPEARDRVLKWASEKFSSRPLLLTDSIEKKVKPSRKKKKTKSATKLSFSIVKDLNLNPEGKSSFQDFVNSKKPKTEQEKCVIAVYYLQNELGIVNISVNHVFTCYKNAKWRITDIYNNLSLAASRKGWLDTSDMNNIKIAPHGENLINLDLPHVTKGK